MRRARPNTESIVLPQEMEMISGIIASYDSFCALFPEYLALSSARADRYYQQRLIPAAAEVREHIHSLRVSNEAALFARKQEASEVVRHAAALLFGTFLVTIIIAYTTARIYTDKLFRPIYEVTQNLKAVPAGQHGTQNQCAGIRRARLSGAGVQQHDPAPAGV